MKFFRLLSPGPTIAAIAFALVALSPYFGVALYGQRQIILVMIFVLLCSGLNLSFGYAGELALGQVAVFAAGAYATAILYNHGVTDILAAVGVGILVAAVVGLISGIPGLRLSRWTLAVVSFFFVLLIPPLTSLFHDQTGGRNGLVGILGPTLLGYKLTSYDFFVFAVVITLLWMLVFRNLVVSRFGQFLHVLAAGPALAQTLGGSVYKLRVQAYVVGALPAGIAGALYTYLTGYLSPEAFTLDVLIAILAATVVGGAKSVWGAPVGAALLVLGPLQGNVFEAWSTAVYGGFLVVVGALFAGGLAGLGRALVRQASTRLAPKGGTEPEPVVDESALTIPGEELVVAGVEKSFAGVKALTGVDLTVRPGTITAIIGPNGAGKTTLLNMVSGLHRVDAGRIELNGRPLAGMPAHRIGQLGVGRTFQTPIIPESLTVLEVVEAGRLMHGRVRFLRSILRLPSYFRERREDREAALAALSFAGLTHLASADASSLPLGTRRLLEVVRSVAGAPNVLLLDEPAAGLDDAGLNELATLIRRARDAGGTVVLVEHNVPFVMEVADEVFVLDLGKVIASGPPSVVRTDQAVINSYLGRRGQAADAAGQGN